MAACFKVTDVRALGQVQTLTLRGTGVSNVDALANVHTLDLSSCQRVRDVSQLGHVHSLNLSGCTHLQNVNALANVHSLFLSMCNVDRSSIFPALSGVPNLVIDGQTYVPKLEPRLESICPFGVL